MLYYSLMNLFISAVMTLAVISALASITAITPVFADQNANRHGLEVSGIAKGHGLDVSSITDFDGRLPGGGCRLQELAQLQGGDVSEVARDFQIDITN